MASIVDGAVSCVMRIGRVVGSLTTIALETVMTMEKIDNGDGDDDGDDAWQWQLQVF